MCIYVIFGVMEMVEEDFRKKAEEKVGLKWIENPQNWDEALQNYEILKEEIYLRQWDGWKKFSETEEGKEWYRKLLDITNRLEIINKELYEMFNVTLVKEGRKKYEKYNKTPKLGFVLLMISHNHLKQSIMFLKEWIESFEKVSGG